MRRDGKYFVDISLTSLHALIVKLPATYFLSYAHNDSPDVERFRKVLAPLLKTSPEFEFSEWIDQQILPGEHWRLQIEAALTKCRFGLLLVSPEFLASAFITSHELPVLLAKPLIVPIALHRITFDGSMDLKGLEDRQVFRDSRNRPFDACRTAPDRRAFAAELYRTIVALLRKYPC